LGYLGLLEKYLHLDRGIVEVQRVLVRLKEGGWGLMEPKTAKSRRNVTLPPQTERALKQWHRQHAAIRLKAGVSYQQNGLVFATPKGTPFHDRNLTLRHFRPILEKAELPTTHTLYTLRHTYATLSLAAGVHPKVVSEALGHSSVAFTMDTYAHVLPSMQEAAAEKIAKLLFG
jgi:integrase